MAFCPWQMVISFPASAVGCGKTDTVAVATVGHPLLVLVYVMICVPFPAKEGMKVFPLMPGPLKDPFAGLPIKVNVLLKLHTVAGNPVIVAFWMVRLMICPLLRVLGKTLLDWSLIVTEEEFQVSVPVEAVTKFR